MTLKDFTKAIATLGEELAQGAREKYIEHLHQLYTEKSSLPGEPRKLNITELSSLMPTRCTTKLTVSLSEKEGEIEVDLYRNEKGSGGWLRRNRKTVADLEIEWTSHPTPEAVCRMRDAGDDTLDHHLRKVKWATIHAANTVSKPKEEKDG